MTKQEALEAVTGQRIDLAEPWRVPNVGAEGPPEAVPTSSEVLARWNDKENRHGR